MRKQRLAHFVPESRNNVHHPGRKSPLSPKSFPNSNAETDEYSDGFQTTVQPAASSGASFHVASSRGGIPRRNRGHHT